MIDDKGLGRLEGLAAEATPGPWYYHNTDDYACMNAVAVTTSPEEPDTQMGEPEEFCREIVALTLYQSPRVVCHGARSWFADGLFIAAAREAVPALVAEVRRVRAALRALLADPSLDDAAKDAIVGVLEGVRPLSR